MDTHPQKNWEEALLQLVRTQPLTEMNKHSQQNFVILQKYKNLPDCCSKSGRLLRIVAIKLAIN